MRYKNNNYTLSVQFCPTFTLKRNTFLSMKTYSRMYVHSSLGMGTSYNLYNIHFTYLTTRLAYLFFQKIKTKSSQPQNKFLEVIHYAKVNIGWMSYYYYTRYLYLSLLPTIFFYVCKKFLI